MVLTYSDLYDNIDYAYDNEKNICFYVKGELVEDLIDYVQYELGCFENDTYRYEDSIKPYKVYALDLLFNEDLHYDLNEAYVNGELIGTDEEEFSTTYVDADCDIRQLDKIKSDIVMFNIVEENLSEDTDEECQCEHCTEECHCDDYEINSTEYTNINGKKTYKVNGKVVDKSEYEDASIRLRVEDLFPSFDLEIPKFATFMLK